MTHRLRTNALDVSNHISAKTDTPVANLSLPDAGTQLLTWHLQVNAQQASQPFCLKKLELRRDSPEEETPLRTGKGRNQSCILGRELCPCTLAQDD